MIPWESHIPGRDPDGEERVWSVRSVGHKRFAPLVRKHTTGVMFERGLYSDKTETALGRYFADVPKLWSMRDELIESDGERLEIAGEYKLAFARYLAVSILRSPAMREFLTGERYAHLRTEEELKKLYDRIMRPGSALAELFIRPTSVMFATSRWTILYAADKGNTFVLSSDPMDYESIAKAQHAGDVIREVGGKDLGARIFPIGPFHALKIEYVLREWLNYKVPSPIVMDKYKFSPFRLLMPFDTKVTSQVTREYVDSQKVQEINTISMSGWNDKFQQWIAYDEPTIKWVSDWLEAKVKEERDAKQAELNYKPKPDQPANSN